MLYRIQKFTVTIKQVHCQKVKKAKDKKCFYIVVLKFSSQLNDTFCWSAVSVFTVFSRVFLSLQLMKC